MKRENEIVWKEQYEIGVYEIDAQHKIFLKTINKIDSAYENKEDKEVIGSLLKELFKYVEFHFSSEENIMLQAEYPQYSTHKKEHEELLYQLTEIMSSYDVDFLDRDELIDFLVNWFREHTSKSDTMLGTYLKSK